MDSLKKFNANPWGLSGHASTSWARWKSQSVKRLQRIFGPRKAFLLQTAGTKRNHRWGLVSNSIEFTAPSAAQSASSTRAGARESYFTSLQVSASRCQTSYNLPWNAEMGILIPPPYSWDILPSDFYSFFSMTHGATNEQSHSYEDISNWPDSWIASIDKHFYRDGV